MKGNVYHCSLTAGLKKLSPKPSTHKKPWVYATKDIATSAMFLGDNWDFICQTGMYDGLPQIYERFKGAFDYAYKNKKGSLYVLDGKNFKEGMTSWSPEVVSEFEEPVLEEVKVHDIEQFLSKLEKEGKLKIYFYPKLPPHAPKDKSDVIEKAVKWTRDFGEHTLEQIEKFHPDVLNKVLTTLVEQDYSFIDTKWKNLANK